MKQLMKINKNIKQILLLTIFFTFNSLSMQALGMNSDSEPEEVTEEMGGSSSRRNSKDDTLIGSSNENEELNVSLSGNESEGSQVKNKKRKKEQAASGSRKKYGKEKSLKKKNKVITSKKDESSSSESEDDKDILFSMMAQLLKQTEPKQKKQKKERPVRSKKLTGLFGVSNNPLADLVSEVSQNEGYELFMKKEGGFNRQGRPMALPFELIVRSTPVALKLMETKFSNELMDKLTDAISKPKKGRSGKFLKEFHQNTFFGDQDMSVNVALAMVANAYSMESEGDYFYGRIISWFNKMKIVKSEEEYWTAKNLYEELRGRSYLKRDIIMSESANNNLWTIFECTFAEGQSSSSLDDDVFDGCINILFENIDSKDLSSRQLRALALKTKGDRDLDAPVSFSNYAIDAIANATDREKKAIIQSFFTCVEKAILNSGRGDKNDEYSSADDDEYGDVEELRYFPDAFLNLLYDNVILHKHNSRVMLEIAVMTMGELNRKLSQYENEKKK
ncbi:hypothetical protein N9V90_02690 [Endozoicomonas sp.]|nr:hypothetical protein [Endozoicomonas sp.]